MRWILATSLLLLALPASADEWFKDCRLGTGAASTQVQSGSEVCAQLDADENTPMLFVRGCDNIDLIWFSDITGGGGANTGRFYACAQPTDASGDGPTDGTWTQADRCFLIENLTLDGDSSTNTEAILGYAATWIYADVASYDAGTALAMVRCNR